MRGRSHVGAARSLRLVAGRVSARPSQTLPAPSSPALCPARPGGVRARTARAPGWLWRDRKPLWRDRRLPARDPSPPVDGRLRCRGSFRPLPRADEGLRLDGSRPSPDATPPPSPRASMPPGTGRRLGRTPQRPRRRPAASQRAGGRRWGQYPRTCRPRFARTRLDVGGPPKISRCCFCALSTSIGIQALIHPRSPWGWIRRTRTDADSGQRFI